MNLALIVLAGLALIAQAGVCIVLVRALDRERADRRLLTGRILNALVAEEPREYVEANRVDAQAGAADFLEQERRARRPSPIADEARITPVGMA
jgi:hypothetical protein